MTGEAKKNEKVTLVCVTAQFKSGGLIREGRRIADETNTKLYVVNVQQKSEWGKKFSKELEYLLMISKNLDAKMLIYFADNPIAIIDDYIEGTNTKHFIFGKSSRNTLDFAEKLHFNSNETEIHSFKYQ